MAHDSTSHVTGDGQRFTSKAQALAHAQNVFADTGQVIAVEEEPTPTDDARSSWEGAYGVSPHSHDSEPFDLLAHLQDEHGVDQALSVAEAKDWHDTEHEHGPWPADLPLGPTPEAVAAAALSPTEAAYRLGQQHGRSAAFLDCTAPSGGPCTCARSRPQPLYLTATERQVVLNALLTYHWADTTGQVEADIADALRDRLED